MRVLYPIILILIGHASYGQIDSVDIKDFSNDWLFFDGKKSLPLVRKSDFKGNAIKFSLDPRTLEGAFLKIEYPSEFALFVNDNLYATADQKLEVGVDKLLKNKKELNITLYADELNPYLLKSNAFKIVNADVTSIGDDVVLINPRKREIFNNFYIVSSVFILAYFTVLMVYYPRTVFEYFKVGRAFSAREMDENLLKSRPFTGVNVSIFLFFSLLLAQLIVSTVYLADLFPEKSIFYSETFWMSIWNWAKVTLLVFLFVHIKFLVLLIFTRLFNLHSFLNSHFMNNIRLCLIAISLLSVVVAVLYFGVYGYHHDVYLSIYRIILIGIIPISVVIFIKLMASASFKNLHLFSYICGTELIPYVLILSLGIN